MLKILANLFTRECCRVGAGTLIFVLICQNCCTDHVVLLNDRRAGPSRCTTWKLEVPGATETVTIPSSRHPPSCFSFADNRQLCNGKLPVAHESHYGPLETCVSV